MQQPRRTFDTLRLEEVVPRTMRDPQQPGFDEASFVVPGSDRSVTAMVERVEFPRLDRAALAAEVASAAKGRTIAQPDPAEEARRIIDEARATARTMLDQAREVVAAERAQAVAQGYAEGFERGRADADAEAAGLISTCEQIGVHVMEERERVLGQSEGELVELAISIARRIVNASLDVDPELVVEACRGAMRKAFQRGSMQVLAHPGDLELLRDAGPALARELGGVDHLDFIEERRLERGSIIVRTPAGEIDATIDGKAAKIEQALREGIEHRRAERRSA